ncbi:MAG: PBP1A family penicillin-binding protein [Acidimicrobiales bacterium]|nr:PBP1A family penicillin-binding protein [Acidimicrobiales bacterium]
MALRRISRALLALVVCASVLAACSYRRSDITPVIPQMSESSRIFAGDGTLLTILHAEQNRQAVPYADFPRSLIDAVVAIEDKRFWEHNGVDLQAVLRAAKANATEGGIAQGGSTITQQYVKNALLNPQQTVNRKLKEMSLAWQLERTTSKELILELYLNTIYFGHGAYGAQAAAQTYFGVPVGQLDLAQSALLAALIQSPSATDPYVAPEAAIERRNLVLGELLAEGKITVPDQLAAKAAPLQLKQEFSAEDRFPAGHFVEEVKQFILGDGRFGDTEEARRNLLFGGGLRIYTTIDLDLQALGEKAIAEVLPDPVSQPDAALVAIEPSSGRVLAMVGGRDFFGDSPYAKVNLAMGAGRQAGSTFKPMVLAAALDSGTALNKVYKASPEMTFDLAPGDEEWTVRNYGGAGGGTVNLVEATIRSYNTVYAQLMLEVGPEAAVAMAHELGIESPLEPVPALVLGTENVTVLEMADAYATFANRGLRVAPQFVSLITDANGTVLYQAPQTQTRVLETETADQLTAVLEQVIERGTGTAAQIDRPVAGKTGTAEEYRDAWFVGYTPQLAVAVWVGYAQQRLAMVPPTTPLTVTGGSWPAEIFQLFTSAATTGQAVEPFAAPEAAVRPFVERPAAAPVEGTTTTVAGQPAPGGTTTTAVGGGPTGPTAPTPSSPPSTSPPTTASPTSAAGGGNGAQDAPDPTTTTKA